MLEDRSYMRSPSFGSGRSVTVWLLIINVAAFIVQLALEHYTRVNPLRYLALSLGGLSHGYVWQLVSFQFLHGGWLHLLLNCWAIYMFGRELEMNLGRGAFLLLYFGSGIVGGLMQVLAGVIFPVFSGPVVGASAGAFGLVAAYATLAPERPLTLLLFFILPISLRAKYLLLFSAIIAVAGILFPSDNVAHAAHLGGMLFGVVFARYGHRIEWRLPRLRFRFPFPRRGRPSLVRVHADKRGAWPIGKTVDVEELPADEFLSREVDPILEKISAKGIHSLTERERRILEKARAKMANR